jgi:glycosyltransferase involved in cell wall biosynthesis
MEVPFINENTMGHASYLVPFVERLRERPELGVQPHQIDAMPLPARLAHRADWSIRGLRRWGLDFQNARWRLAVSRHVREQLEQLRARHRVEAVVVNTQSVGLELAAVAQELPVFVCLDATFCQLARSRWFAPNSLSRWFLPFTLAPVRGRERALLRCARRLLPWSEAARQSLIKDYGLPAERISLLPPSVNVPPPRSQQRPGRERPQILFIGGDFRRKGGPLLLETFRAHFAGRCDLHLVTHADVPSEPGVTVHRGVCAGSEAWRERWEQADVFVFPSTLETFGIVLVEALAFGVPVVSADVGAAREVLAGGQAGWLLPGLTAAALAAAIREALDRPELAGAKAARGRQHISQVYDRSTNTDRLAKWLTGAHAD